MEQQQLLGEIKHHSRLCNDSILHRNMLVFWTQRPTEWLVLKCGRPVHPQCVCKLSEAWTCNSLSPQDPSAPRNEPFFPKVFEWFLHICVLRIQCCDEMPLLWWVFHLIGYFPAAGDGVWLKGIRLSLTLFCVLWSVCLALGHLGHLCKSDVG